MQRRTKIAYAVFTRTDQGNEYLVKGNFGNDKEKAEKWAKENDIITHPIGEPENTQAFFPHGLFVKKLNY